MIKVTTIIEELQKESLLKETNISENNDLIVTGKIVTDSRKVSVNDVFICIKGFSSDGHLYAQKAISDGAVLLITEYLLPISFSQIVVNHSRKATAILARIFYDDPSSKLKLIGITGTNGKTTTASLTTQLFNLCGYKTGFIGTIGYEINGKHYPSDRTTPDIIELHEIFVQMIQEGVAYVIMEVSSHAVALDRIYGLHFVISAFTNLTRDHLDFHKDMEEYAETKYSFIAHTVFNGGKAIINIDDSFGSIIASRLAPNCIGITSTNKAYPIATRISQLEFDLKGSHFTLNCPDGKTERYFSQLCGRYNIYNTVFAIQILKSINPQIAYEDIKNYVGTIHSVDGRLERVSIDEITAYVDYAHTPDALENVLITLCETKPERIITVFGAGGDRDPGKRSQMLEKALEGSDLVIVTSDNPRTENPVSIVKEIVNNTDYHKHFIVIVDRRDAIRAAVNLIRKKDILLVAGKGHETYQEINGVKHHFDDREEIVSAYKERTATGIEDTLLIPFDPIMLEIMFNITLSREISTNVIKAISTDSRVIDDNSLFIPLVGETFDGHNFIPNVLEQTNAFCLANKGYYSDNPRVIHVEDTLYALGEIARKYRQLFTIVSIAITGSVGKTTTKEFCYNVLSQRGCTLKTFANENNLIGLPKTIFRLQPSYEYAIFEIGTNQFGEIARLTEICAPDYGIITNIGPSHLEYLINEDGVYTEKSSLFKSGLKQALYPKADTRFSEWEKQYLSFGYEDGSNYQISDIQRTTNSTTFTVNQRLFNIPSTVPYHVENAGIAIALGSILGFEDFEIQRGIQLPLEISMRMQREVKNNKELLIDCYNANPLSMEAGIHYWLELSPNKTHIAILGDMLELGEKSPDFHEAIGKLLSEYKSEKYIILSVGKSSIAYNANRHFFTVEDLLQSGIIDTLPQDSVLLIKASHGIHLEKIIGRI